MRRFCCGDGWHPSSAHHQLTSSPKKVLLALTSQKQTRPRNCWQGKLAFKNRRFALQISLEDLGDIGVFELKSWIRIYLLVWGLDMYWRCSSQSSPMPRQSISRAIHGASAPLPDVFSQSTLTIVLIGWVQWGSGQFQNKVNLQAGDNLKHKWTSSSASKSMGPLLSCSLMKYATQVFDCQLRHTGLRKKVGSRGSRFPQKHIPNLHIVPLKPGQFEGLILLDQSTLICGDVLKKRSQNENQWIDPCPPQLRYQKNSIRHQN